MYVTATEFRTNVGKYLDLMLKEDIFIVKYGKPIGVLSASRKMKGLMIESLKGSYSYEGDVEEFILRKRTEDYESLD